MMVDSVHGAFLLGDPSYGSEGELPGSVDWHGTFIERPWWLRIGHERLVVSELCRANGCEESASPVDLYCPDPEHGDLLVFQDSPSGRKRWWAANAARTVAVALVVLSASADSRWPIYMLASVIGACCVGLLLRAHRVGRAVGIAGWLVAAVAAGAVAALTLDGDGMRIVGTLAVGLPLVGSTILGVLVARYASRDLVNGVVREATRAVAMSGLTAALAVSGWWATTGMFADRFVDVSASVSRWFLFAGLCAALSAALAAAIGALLLSMHELDRGVRPLIATMPQAYRVHCTYRPLAEAPLRHDPGAQILWRLTRLGQRLWRSAKRLYVQTVNGVLAVVAAGGRLICRGVNWAHRRLVLARRVVVFVIVRGMRLVLAGMSVGAQAGRYCARPIGAYVAAVGGSVAAVHLADAYTRYLVDGPLRALAAGTVWSVLGLAACVVVVERLVSVRSRLVIEAVGRFVSNAGPDVVLLVVLSGWVVGVPGTLGYGPIRVGWVTGVGTLALMALMAPAWAQGRRDQRSGLEAAAGPDEAVSGIR